MRVLIGCEFSGIVREAFRKRGHDAWSCDLLASEISGQHLQGDVLKWLNGKPQIVSTMKPEPWDLIIAHPPCTYLCNSGVRWLAPDGVLNKERHGKMMKACDFFAALWFTSSMYGCVENPIMHKYARDYLYSTWKICLPTQRVQPYQFGNGETKNTCLWLRGLPKLVPTNIVAGREHRIHRMPPSPNRGRERSRTFQGIADAMAEQWGNL